MANVVAIFLVLATIPFFSAILRAPFSVVGPAIIVICLVSAYTIGGKMFDVYIALCFGVVGYVFKKLDYPIAPLILAMVLGDKSEDSFRQAMLLSEGSLAIFFSNGLVSSICSIAMRCRAARLPTAASRRPLPAPPDPSSGRTSK